MSTATATAAPKTKPTKVKSSPSSKAGAKGKNTKTSPAKPTAGKKPSAKDKVIEALKTATAKVETDRFGSRIGSNLALVNAALSKTPKTIPQIAKDAGLDNTFFRKHMKKLVETGKVLSTDEGYKLAAKK